MMVDANKELIVNFSGGKDSTAMLHLLLEHGEKVDEVIYFDGGWEFPQMAEHVALVEKKTGLSITKLQPREGNFDYWAYQRKYYKRDKNTIRHGYSWPGGNQRWCTRLKIESIEKYLKGRDVVHAIGFAVGEEKRAQKKGVRDMQKYRFPLFEYNFDEVDCLEYCYKLGYDWNGLYKYLPRISCFCCPFLDRRSILILKRHYPDIWEMIRKKNELINQNRDGIGYASRWKTDLTFEDLDASIRGRDEDWDPQEWIEKLNQTKPIQIDSIKSEDQMFLDL